jgi:hypothetical protein
VTDEQAKVVLQREGWTLVDLYYLVEAFASLTDAGFDMKGPRVQVIIKKLPLRKPAKKVKR